MLRRLQSLGLRRGIIGASRVWYWVAVVTTALRVLRRLVGRSEKVVYCEELQPGQTLVIAHERDATVSS